MEFGAPRVVMKYSPKKEITSTPMITTVTECDVLYGAVNLTGGELFLKINNLEILLSLPTKALKSFNESVLQVVCTYVRIRQLLRKINCEMFNGKQRNKSSFTKITLLIFRSILQLFLFETYVTI